MTTVSAINGPITNVQPTQAVVAAIAQAPVASANQSSLGTVKANTAASQFLSDPLSGVLITQFLNNSGDIVTQIPSTTVIAYLRNGLSADGFPRHSANETTA